MSSEDVITDFAVWPEQGEAPLLVALFARVNRSGSGITRRVWALENGKKVKEEDYSEITSYTYEKPGMFNDNLSIKLMSKGGDPGGSRDFTITVKEPELRQNPLIRDVVHEGGTGYALQNEKVQFSATLPSVPGMSAIEELSWDFGDDTGKVPGDKGSYDKTHVYTKAGKYTGKLTVKVKGRGTDSKSFDIMIISKL